MKDLTEAAEGFLCARNERTDERTIEWPNIFVPIESIQLKYTRRFGRRVLVNELIIAFSLET